MAIVKTVAEIGWLRESSAINAAGLSAVLAVMTPGVTGDELDEVFVDTITALGGTPSFLGYHDYPKSICISINHEVVHGIPSSRSLKAGDVVGIDCGVRYKKYCSDMARTVIVGGTGTDSARRLVQTTQAAFTAGLEKMRPGYTTGDVGAAVQAVAQAAGFGVVRALVGHGVGQHVHEEPQLPNFGPAGKGVKLQAGMVLALEPMITVGSYEVEFDASDGWTVRTADGSLAAHVEDTILITDTAPEILTHIS